MIIPILRSFDEGKLRAFYLDYLGFVIDWEHRFGPDMPLYLQVARGDWVIHLSEHHGDACPGAALRLSTDKLDALLAEWRTKGYAYANPTIETMPWGCRELQVRDPFGNRLVFTEPLPSEENA
ncbi:glyoxalase superfamily protein [Aeromonas hydrophila]|uniref:glyoxalase superfamily protein n=1 Tax=Aeromonas hydrophila TaxID=644 RepID=UPI00076014B0|nr:glyoxalase superfamily protein [Aeromonas hydrophila]KWR66966.1 glyoxalase [Aeromonas hydrophila]MBW3843917.1 VOC family protein [Aeromonas hydrophila]MCR3951300.1 VOC family protein [Aeromonas hydrophila]MCX4114712.1 glyoxalase superfamily protein [Aeromonas hydrophila]OSP49903.1 glyoxalase/bleomycin resistance/extradiol dioxygenase family protein [Aeromonas hydrophila]